MRLLLAGLFIFLTSCTGQGLGGFVVNDSTSGGSGDGGALEPKPRPCAVLSSSYAATLLDVAQRDGVRVFYTTNPADADVLPDLTDADGDGVPDYVENILRQAVHARAAYNGLGFRDPLNSPRYKAFGVKFIDIHVRAMADNGLAYDEAITYDNNPLMKDVCGVRIDLSNNLASFPGTWSVVAHELFHLYQYGYSMFKQSWFLEGMTAYAERVIRVGGVKGMGTTTLPATQNDLDTLVYAVPYNALFDRLAYLAEQDQAADMPLNPALFAGAYTDGSLIFKDRLLWGYPLIRKMLENVEEESKKISKEKSWDPVSWAESDQKDAQYQARVMRAIMKAVRDSNLATGGVAAEVNAFLALTPP
ncbi:MAG: hypothetical protein KF802_06605 [Bdellovibrionaceae bacterium]|nr:hypothetical protein [Pseudobdellovibrionaceae bacterium]